MVEIGPLSALPEDESPPSKEAIPEEDTLVFLGEPEKGVGVIWLAINAEVGDIVPFRPLEDNSADPMQPVLTDLILRVNYQVAQWILQGKLADNSVLLFYIAVREAKFHFAYSLDGFPQE